MKLRVMGRYDECAAFAAIIAQNVPARYLRSISPWYPNRGISTEGRDFFAAANEYFSEYIRTRSVA